MKVWTVINNYGNGDECYCDNYIQAFEELEMATEEDENILDSEWYDIFRRERMGDTWQPLDLKGLKEVGIIIGEWVLVEKSMTIEQFENIGEFEGW